MQLPGRGFALADVNACHSAEFDLLSGTTSLFSGSADRCLHGPLRRCVQCVHALELVQQCGSNEKAYLTEAETVSQGWSVELDGHIKQHRTFATNAKLETIFVAATQLRQLEIAQRE